MIVWVDVTESGKEELFIDVINYIAELKGMIFEEYKDYVYSCNPKSK